jgi:hypothetical protein
MKQRKMWTTALTLVLALTCLSFKCGGGGGNGSTNVNNDAKRKYVKAADDIAGAIHSMIGAAKNLQKQGRISADEEKSLLQLLDAANNADTALYNKLKATTTVDASNKSELLSLLSQVTSAVNDLNNSGVLKLGNADAKQRLTTFLSTINAALAILNGLNT